MDDQTASPGPAVLFVLHSDATGISQAVENVSASESLATVAGLVRDTLTKLVGLPEYSHVAFLESPEAYSAGDVTSPLCLVVGPPVFNEAGELQGVSSADQVFDLLGAMTAQRMLPDLFTGKVGLDEDGALGFTDDAMGKLAAKLNDQLSQAQEAGYQELVNEDADAELAEALGELMPEDTELLPLHPEDMLALLPVYVATVAGKPPKRKAPRRQGDGAGPLARLGRVFATAWGAGTDLVWRARYQLHTARKLVWRMEDIGLAVLRGGKRVALHAARPLLVAFIVNRAFTTVVASADVRFRLARMSTRDAFDYQMKSLLGDNVQEQMEEDLDAAISEVEAGLATDDYKDEKRMMSAAMLRRLEVEDWDKERMKNFYYGSYGLGPWYFDMEERLHNPYFIGARAWNGPIENWTNKNKVYMRDMQPQFAQDAAKTVAAVEDAMGRPLTVQQRARVLAKNGMLAAM